MRWSEYDEIYLEPRHEVEDAMWNARVIDEIERSNEAAVEEMERDIEQAEKEF